MTQVKNHLKMIRKRRLLLNHKQLPPKLVTRDQELLLRQVVLLRKLPQLLTSKQRMFKKQLLTKRLPQATIHLKKNHLRKTLKFYPQKLLQQRKLQLKKQRIAVMNPVQIMNHHQKKKSQRLL
jgi:hypothetical protein